jgi:UDP-2,3-diacylglucosamine hydrolase
MKLSLSSEASSAVFISDLHLSHDRDNKLFLDFIKNVPTITDHLFILGDLFDYWVGDDSGLYVKECEALRDLSRKINIFFLHGNRDFLVGKKFFQETQITKLDEVTELYLNNNSSALLIHGDTLCTDDKDYQNFRSKVRSIEWKEKFLLKPLSERIEIAHQMREKSREANRQKSQAITDVNNEDTIKLIEKFNFIPLIHGHTHRRKIHKNIYDNHEHYRYVLGDWTEKYGNYLIWSEKENFTFNEIS